jgi:hypothetical protein
MAGINLIVETRFPLENNGSKVADSNFVAPESLSDLESDSATSARRPGSLWTIIGCVSDR